MLHKRSTRAISRRDALRLMAITAGLAATPSVALADTKTDLANAQQRLAEAESKLSAIAAEYEELSAAQSVTLDDLDEVETKIENTNERIASLEDDLKVKQDELSKNISEEYKDGNHGVVDLILGATSVEELISNFYYYGKVSEEKARLIQDVKDAHEQLENKRAELKEQQEDLKEVSRVQAEQLDAMRNKQYEAQQVIDGLDKEVRDLVAKRDAELLAAQQEAEKARKEREAAQKAAAAQNAQEEQTQQQTDTNAVSIEDTSKKDGGQSSTQPEPEPVEEPEPEPEEETPSGSSGRGGNGTGSAAAVVAACYSTPSPGLGLCAGWCSNVMINAGYGYVAGNANDMYAEFCFSSNRADLMPGMAVAVSSHPHTTMGRIYGHIGMYIGNGMMMDNIGYIRTISVDEWCDFYGQTVSPRWGWLNGIALS